MMLLQSFRQIKLRAVVGFVLSAPAYIIEQVHANEHDFGLGAPLAFYPYSHKNCAPWVYACAVMMFYMSTGNVLLSTVLLHQLTR